ncbi:hypothetical protein ES707_17625 [subsurface metagenome]
MKKTVTLKPEESQVVGFSFTPSVAKSHVVSINGLTGSFTAFEVPVAEFEVTDLVIEPTGVYVGETVSVSVRVTNVGNLAGSYEIVCEVT